MFGWEVTGNFRNVYGVVEMGGEGLPAWGGPAKEECLLGQGSQEGGAPALTRPAAVLCPQGGIQPVQRLGSRLPSPQLHVKEHLCLGSFDRDGSRFLRGDSVCSLGPDHQVNYRWFVVDRTPLLGIFHIGVGSRPGICWPLGPH